MKIVFDALEAQDREVIEKELVGHELVFLDHAIAEDEQIEDAEALCVFVASQLSAATTEGMPSLKFVVTRSMGYDHIDLEALRARNIPLAYVPHYGVRTVAEFAFALILALSRKAYAARDRLREDGTTDVKDFEGFDLAGKTLGVIGTGNIGKNTARIAKGFAMNVLLSDVHEDAEFAKEVDGRYLPLGDMVAQSDIVSIHVPYMEATHHIINADVLAKFKKGSYFINTARGALVDSEALIKALQDGHIAGAGLDVVEGERELRDELSLLTDLHHDINDFKALVMATALLDMPNVIMTPHIAFNSREAKREILDTTIENIRAYAKGEPMNVAKV